MNVFGESYSKYYNLLYKDKNYKSEFEYIYEKLIKKNISGDYKTILDIGCGTGKHLKYFKEKGLDVSGVDLSENMICRAKEYLSQEENLLCSRASDFSFGHKFDVIVSLFHVMSYQTCNNELNKVFENVSNHLNKDGLFIFDFWYGPAVLTDPPVVRIKRLEDDEVNITRLTEPALRENENIVDVNFELLLEDKKTREISKFKETHNMRYLFLPEIINYCELNDLKLIKSYEWMTENNLSNNSWYGVVVIKK